ncbi:uncharacterized protein LOC142222197 [Haematobia irritans]|uniref:uncharacterized protein LOC142222197 n=1 Tax=Haematobia irritans TaxID=7368 RepID=UPI003F50C7F3
MDSKTSGINESFSSLDYIKRIAFEHLHKTLKDQLDFITNINHCQEYDLNEVETISHNIFSWSYEDFLERRQLENCVWADVVAIKSSQECLEKQKAKADMKELKRFIDLIFKVSYNMCNGVSKNGEIMDEQLWKPLRDAEWYHNLPEMLIQEREKLRSEFDEIKARAITENITENLDQQQNRIMALEDLVTNADVWGPIEMRYEIKWYQSMVNQNKYEKELLHSEYEKEIEKLRTKTLNEKLCGNSIMDTYYSLVEQYKRQINDFQERYDLEYEVMENKNNYIQAQIDKLRDAKNWHKQEIERFHSEIQKRLEKEERERQQAEIKRQEEEAAALALLEAQKLRKRQKGKGKGGPKSKIPKTK